MSGPAIPAGVSSTRRNQRSFNTTFGDGRVLDLNRGQREGTWTP